MWSFEDSKQVFMQVQNMEQLDRWQLSGRALDTRYSLTLRARHALYLFHTADTDKTRQFCLVRVGGCEICITVPTPLLPLAKILSPCGA